MELTDSLSDTNILIDYLRGIPEAAAELDSQRNRAISVITWIEVIAGTTAETESLARNLLKDFVVFELTTEIAEHAARLRRELKLKVPDAIILATARLTDRKLVTRNTRDFPQTMAGVRVPYIV